MPARLNDPEQLRELLGIPFTAEQTAAITAPAAPQVIVAGAGSGKTTVMAARVVWLVGTGQVAPERVLGLTFTNKAAGELSERVRRALHRAGVLEPPAPAAALPAQRPTPDSTPDSTPDGAWDSSRAAPGAPPPATEPETPGEPEISTYHAFAGRLLGEHGLRIGIEPASRLLADASRFQLAAEVLRSAPATFTAPTGSSTGNPRRFTALVEDLIALDGELSEHLVQPDRLQAHDERLRQRLAAAPLSNAALRRIPEAARGRLELLDRVREYRTRKRSRDLLDFGDQIALSATLARDVPEAGRALRERYSVVLLDEYQDTSVAQRILLSGLFGDGTGHPVTAVGDPCQAIYGWRGASVANLDDFPDHFAHRDGTPATRYQLTENRRSGGRLLRLANDIAAPLRSRHPGVAPLRPAEEAANSGRVRCALLPTQPAELDWLADRLAHLVRTGTPPGEIAVLCRTAADFGEIQRVLVERGVPVEVVGLAGLLHLPEVADLVAVCQVLADPTANAPLVRLLTGPRWRIGPRDLAMLGRRARQLVRRPEETADRLASAAGETDPAEVISLADALDTFSGTADGGLLEPEDGLPFSDEARMRFRYLSGELRELRRAVSEPLMDVLYRVLAATGLEVELSASPQALAARRRETLSAFLDVAAGYAASGHTTTLDREATLPAFLSYLRAAAEHDNGLNSSLPSTADTVKVLTVHKAKGLEWDVVALPGLYHGGFPQNRAQDSWLKHSHTLPFPLRGDTGTLPAIAEWDAASLKEYEEQAAGHRELEELRLGYVAVTRPRSLLLGSAHRWGSNQKKPRRPSRFLEDLRLHCEVSADHGEVEHWTEPPAEDAENPLLAAGPAEQPWPLPLDPAALRLRRDAAERVLTRLRGLESGELPPQRGHGPVGAGGVDGAGSADGAGSGPGPGPGPGPGSGPVAGSAAGSAESGLTPEEQRTVDSWDRDLETLAGELRRSRERSRDVLLPASLSASQLQRLAADPEGFARELARPMPRRPQPAARRGTRFHAWVESRFEELALPMLGPDELPGGDPDEDDPEIHDERDLSALKDAFERSPYARRTPVQVEAPFQLRLAGRIVRGRIDAVYQDGDSYEIIDWKTGHSRDADPLQLAVYRVAWAELREVPLARVTAAFLYVRTGELVRPVVLPDRAGLEQILRGEVSWSLNLPG